MSVVDALPKDQHDSSPPTWRLADRLDKSCSATRRFIVENYLPLSFAVVLTWALAWPYPGKVVVDILGPHDVRIVQKINMIIVFLITGVSLKTDDIAKAFKYSRGIIYGTVATLLLTPVLGFFFRALPLQPREFSIGLAIFCVVPTTLGVGVALVRQCKGNEGLALLLTVGTNMLAVATMPLLLKLLLLDVSGVNVSVDIPSLLVNLIVTVLAPSLVGKALREFSRPVKLFVNTYKVELTMLSTTSLAMIVWQNLSGARDVLFEQSAVDIVAVGLLAAAQHFIYLVANALVLRYVLPMPAPEAVAVWIMSSQKSSPVHITLVASIARSSASLGLMVVPAVMGQLIQIFVGSLLAARVAPWMDAWQKAESARAAAGRGPGAPEVQQAPPPGPQDTAPTQLQDSTLNQSTAGDVEEARLAHPVQSGSQYAGREETAGQGIGGDVQMGLHTQGERGGSVQDGSRGGVTLQVHTAVEAFPAHSRALAEGVEGVRQCWGAEHACGDLDPAVEGVKHAWALLGDTALREQRPNTVWPLDVDRPP